MDEAIKLENLPNVCLIRSEKYRIIRNSIPREARKELSAGVKAGFLGREKKTASLNEIYYHPDHRDEAIAERIREEIIALKCMANVFSSTK